MTVLTEISYKRIPVLRYMVVVMIIISIIFQSIISYVQDETSFSNFSKDVVITIVVESIFCCVIYFWKQLFNSQFNKNRFLWVKYSLEFLLSCTTCFYILIGALFLQHSMFLSFREIFSRVDFRLHLSINVIAIIFIYAMASVLNLYQLMLDKSAHAEQLQQKFAQVRLLALKTQVNPHFLFNSLSVLSSLVHVNAVASEKFIVQLAKAYRYILEQKDTELVRLKDELDFLDAYFYLLTIRFENKIILIKNIQLRAEDWYLPPLSLQMLVENAVKHNKMSALEPLRITLNSFADRLQVTNNISAREEDVISTGIGLENIKKRLAYLTESEISILNTGTTFSVNIPLVKNKI